MLFILVTAAILPFTLAQCPYAYTPLNGGTVCSASTYCQALGGSGYSCMNNQCCRPNGLCNVDEVALGYQCLKIAYEGGSCVNTIQCQPNGALTCINGRCSRTSSDTGVTCSKPGQVAERQNGGILNCMYSACSVGFGCEYNQLINQYICCGMYNAQNDYTYAPPVTYPPNRQRDPTVGQGRVRTYPGSSLPLKCFGSSDCLFDDTPNCVSSTRYGYFVCCSTFNC